MKTMNFLETIEACDLKVGRCRQLIEFMTEGQGHFLTLAQGHLHMKIKNAFLRNTWPFLTKFCM